MMMSREVCRRCFKRHGKEWGEYEDAAWEPMKIAGTKASGTVRCPESRTFTVYVDEPPEFCPYDFEHTVAATMTWVEYMERRAYSGDELRKIAWKTDPTRSETS